MAERGGFEPPVRFNPYNGLANRRIRPLCHLSKPTNRLSQRAFSSKVKHGWTNFGRRPWQDEVVAFGEVTIPKSKPPRIAMLLAGIGAVGRNKSKRRPPDLRNLACLCMRIDWETIRASP